MAFEGSIPEGPSQGPIASQRATAFPLGIPWQRTEPLITNVTLDFGRRCGRPTRARRPPVNSVDGYLTRAQACSYLGMSLRWLESNNSIPKRDVSRPGSKRPTWRYLKKDLDQWMASPKNGRAV